MTGPRQKDFKNLDVAIKELKQALSQFKVNRSQILESSQSSKDQLTEIAASTLDNKTLLTKLAENSKLQTLMMEKLLKTTEQIAANTKKDGGVHTEAEDVVVDEGEEQTSVGDSVESVGKYSLTEDEGNSTESLWVNDLISESVETKAISRVEEEEEEFELLIPSFLFEEIAKAEFNEFTKRTQVEFGETKCEVKDNLKESFILHNKPLGKDYFTLNFDLNRKLFDRGKKLKLSPEYVVGSIPWYFYHDSVKLFDKFDEGKVQELVYNHGYQPDCRCTNFSIKFWKISANFFLEKKVFVKMPIRTTVFIREMCAKFFSPTLCCEYTYAIHHIFLGGISSSVCFNLMCRVIDRGKVFDGTICLHDYGGNWVSEMDLRQICADVMLLLDVSFVPLHAQQEYSGYTQSLFVVYHAKEIHSWRRAFRKASGVMNTILVIWSQAGSVCLDRLFRGAYISASDSSTQVTGTLKFGVLLILHGCTLQIMVLQKSLNNRHNDAVYILFPLWHGLTNDVASSIHKLLLISDGEHGLGNVSHTLCREACYGLWLEVFSWTNYFTMIAVDIHEEDVLKVLLNKCEYLLFLISSVPTIVRAQVCLLGTGSFLCSLLLTSGHCPAVVYFLIHFWCYRIDLPLVLAAYKQNLIWGLASTHDDQLECLLVDIPEVFEQLHIHFCPASEIKITFMGIQNANVLMLMISLEWKCAANGSAQLACIPVQARSLNVIAPRVIPHLMLLFYGAKSVGFRFILLIVIAGYIKWLFLVMESKRAIQNMHNLLADKLLYKLLGYRSYSKFSFVRTSTTNEEESLIILGDELLKFLLLEYLKWKFRLLYTRVWDAENVSLINVILISAVSFSTIKCYGANSMRGKSGYASVRSLTNQGRARKEKLVGYLRWKYRTLSHGWWNVVAIDGCALVLVIRPHKQIPVCRKEISGFQGLVSRCKWASQGNSLRPYVLGFTFVSGGATTYAVNQLEPDDVLTSSCFSMCSRR